MYNRAKTIFVIEDDPDTAFVLDRALENAGYRVENLAGVDIVDRQHHWPDLFILDKELPAIDGLALCKFLRVRLETRGIPIIMISAYAVERQARSAGANEFLPKPFRLNQLLAVVQRIVSQYYMDRNKKPIIYDGPI